MHVFVSISILGNNTLLVSLRYSIEGPASANKISISAQIAIIEP
jgi:hypothetical protein